MAASSHLPSSEEDTAAAQQPAIQAAIQSHAAGIVIAGNDPQAVCPALKQAQAQGTKIVAFDSDVNCRQLFINQADTETIGRSQIQLLAKLMQARGLSTEGQVADGTECLDCIQTHGDQARAALERDRKMEAEFARAEAEQAGRGGRDRDK